MELVEIFVLANLAFLAVDIRLAHEVNQFAHPAEWIPFWFSIVGSIALAPFVLRRRSLTGTGVTVGHIVGAGSIIVGVVGLILHLESSFFELQTLKNLVYTAPFAAPLAYTGVGLLLVLGRLERDPKTWSAWVVFLALGGFIGNLALSLADHAQNGFFVATEWIAVVAAACGTSFLAVAVLRPGDDILLRACLLLMAIEVAVGGLGFVLHVTASVGGPADSLKDRIVYGAPIFAPLLFANIAILAAVGLWRLRAEAVGARS